VERPDKSAAEQKTKRADSAKKGPSFTKIVSPPLIPSNSKEVKEVLLFSHSQTKRVVFLSQIPSKSENYWRQNLFPQRRPTFLPDWTESSAKSWQH
jgi:hypothetical protein